MHAMASTQAMRLRAVIPIRRFVTARASTGFIESPVSNGPVNLISGFGVPTMRDEQVDLEWLDRGIWGVTKSRQPGVEPGQATPHHPLVVPHHHRTGRARGHAQDPTGDLHVLLEVHPGPRS